MPELDFTERALPTISPDRAQMRSHKTLPRKTDLLQDVEPTSRSDSSELQADSHLVNGSSFRATAPSLPLTPPSLPVESKKQSTPILLFDSSQPQTPDVTANQTPTRQTNILTPDITPPRLLSESRKRPVQHRKFPSMSSRTESFKTAREVLSSDDDVEASNIPSVSSLPPSWTGLPRSPRTHDGIDESDQHPGPNSQRRPARRMKEKSSTNSYHFNSFDGNWGENETEPIKLRKVRNKREHRSVVKSDEASPKTEASATPIQGTGVRLNRERSLRERVKKSKNVVSSPSVEEFGKGIGWFSMEDRDGHSCRLSGVSTTSTIEAVIIDTPPRKKPTLRHAEKSESLRSVSSPIPYSTRGTLMLPAPEQGHRLARKNARITNQDRLSAASDNISLASITTYSKPKQAEEVIPVIVIPQRQSSLKSSTCGSREHSRTHSMVENGRPTTAPDGRTASRAFDFPDRRRTVSESLPYSRKSNDATRHVPTSRPRIPVRRSSLSAPTSRNPSRTTSLTSDNLQRHEFAQEAHDFSNQKAQKEVEDMQTIHPVISKAEPLEFRSIVAPQDNEHHRLSVEMHPNGVLLQTPSLPKTPFQPSIQSLSPGPIEISEARAVPFFAHNNKSLLVVEQYPQIAPRVQRLYAPTTDLGVTLVEPRTPIVDSKDQPSVIDSPLRNPRPPPVPPVLRVVPPTLLGNSYSQPDHLPTNSTESSNGLVQRWGSLRRSFNSKRYSRGQEPGQHVHRFRNRRAGKEIDSKLYPFWRPRGFWEDIKDSDTDGETAQRKLMSRNPSERSDVYVGNSLGIPQSRSHQGALGLIRRLSNRSRLRAPRRRNASHTSIFSATLSLSGRRDGKYVLKHLLSMREMQAWLSRVRRKREQEKLEARRNKLRHMIGEKVTVDPNLVTARYHHPARSAFDS
ncbi:hypothetical protein PRK78_004424 [Emydomyces testavorans]|uniref:Uncharacterized protein n=1 Tax=Emydomyces testavorans TaxID=2070801 RepID=A0AAF0DK71_9EURO|nr:hypothetical protein PRK78_004424 [Emydomyces testavorans]